MKQWIFVAMVVVSGLSQGETLPPTTAGGSHSGGKAPQTQASFQPQAPRQDPFVRLNNLVQACLVPQGSASRNSNLGRSK